MKKIAIFASGDGSNAEAIVKYFASNDNIKVEIVLSNRLSAGVHERMARLNIPSITFTKEDWQQSYKIIDKLNELSIDIIVLAGFLTIIQPPIIKAFIDRIINIHPSLLPRHGGAGMWGMNVHRSVLEVGDRESGITIHYVDESVDSGEIIAQYKCEVKNDDTPESLANRVHSLEHYYFPRVIEKILS
ncbi:MAG: phosphoribosylglycinamide formyltransferase [Bacteroidales bacterium]|nr:phosphoribosylglycinamide formyltransferase [Bacteroidales bacterium]